MRRIQKCFETFVFKVILSYNYVIFLKKNKINY